MSKKKFNWKNFLLGGGAVNFIARKLFSIDKKSKMKIKTIKSVHLLDISNLMVSLGIKDSFNKGILWFVVYG